MIFTKYLGPDAFTVRNQKTPQASD